MALLRRLTATMSDAAGVYLAGEELSLLDRWAGWELGGPGDGGGGGGSARGGIRTFAERGGLGGSFLFYWSKPYGWMFRHRGISHEHFVGTITRVLIMGLWLLPLVPLIVFGVDWKIVAPYSAWVFLGLTVADSMHIAADGGRRQLEHRE